MMNIILILVLIYFDSFLEADILTYIFEKHFKRKQEHKIMHIAKFTKQIPALCNVISKRKL